MIKRLLTILILISIIGTCSTLPMSPLADRITEQLKKYRELTIKDCTEREELNVCF